MTEQTTTPESTPQQLQQQLLEEKKEREMQFEVCVAVFKEVYSVILSVNAMLTEQGDFVFQPAYLEVLQKFFLFVHAYNKLMGSYVKNDGDFSERLKIYKVEKEKFAGHVEKEFAHVFSFSRNFPEESQIAQYMSVEKNMIAGASAIHSYGNDVFAFTTLAESLQRKRNKYKNDSLQNPVENIELQKLQDLILSLDSDVKKFRSGLSASAEIVIRDLKEGYFTELGGDVSKYVTLVRDYSLELFSQLFESKPKGEEVLLLPNSPSPFESTKSEAKYKCDFADGLLRQWVKDSLENSYKAFRAYRNAQKPSAHFKSITVKTAANSMRNNLQDRNQFADNRASVADTFKVQLQIFKESEAGVDYAVFAIVDNGMGIEGERKKFEYGEGGYDGKQHSSAVGMAMLAKSVASYSADIELRARTDGKRGAMSVLRIPIEKQEVLPEKADNSLPSESIAS